MRASEHIESEETFVRLFSPEALKVLPKDTPWDHPLVARSAPGGGKTSLLRIFTPASLSTVYSMQSHCRELYQLLRDLGVLNNDGPTVLGVLLSCSQGSYANLHDLGIDLALRRRLLLSLLNARITLACLHGASRLARLRHPEDLAQLEVVCPSAGPNSGSQEWPAPCTGRELFEWAEQLELSVCTALDSLAPLTQHTVRGHDSLVAFQMLAPESLLVNGRSVCSRILFMLDDIHRLAADQRRFLLETVVGARFRSPVWLSERFEALSTDELLSDGATEGRDFAGVVALEDHWRQGAGRAFERVLKDIADRRAARAAAPNIGAFADCLQDSLDGAEWQDKFRSAEDAIADRVRSRAGGRGRYAEWLSACEAMAGTPRERAVAWRRVEILIEREERKTQESFDFTLGTDELERRDDSAVRAAAELFLCRELKAPYYYGMSRLSAMASCNIEQFLVLAGDLFEEAAATALLGQPAFLSPEQQERILRNAIGRTWRTVPQTIRHGPDVQAFIESIGRFAREVTYQPNAPYAPGVTGIAILMEDRERLRDPGLREANPDLDRAGRVIASAIANNLLEVTLNRVCKGQRWMLLNLNRMLCVHFGLPLQYGGWREKGLKELVRFLDRTDSPTRKGGLFT